MDFKRKDEYDPALEDGFQEDSEMVETSGDKGGMTKRVAVLAGIGVLAAALLIAGLVKGCGGRKGEKPDGMQAVFEQYLEADGNALDALDSLSEAEQQKVISAAISTLERLVGDGSGNYDREKVISELEQVLSDLNLGLPETTIHTIAEKLVELYTNNYESAYTEVEKNNNSIKQLGDTVTKQMQENLYTVTDYLTQLDTQIVTNQSTLEQVLNSSQELGDNVTQLTEKTEAIRNQLSSTLTEIKTEFGNVSTQLTKQQEKLDAFYAKYDQNSEKINSGITNIQNSITDTKNQISSTEQKITDVLADMEKNNVTRQNEVSQKLSEVNQQIKNTQDQLTKLEKNVQDALEELDGNMEERHEELVDILEDMEKTLQKALAEQLESIKNGFSDLEKSLQDSLAELQGNFDLSVLELKGKLDSIHEQIAMVQKQIGETLTAMDEKRDLQYEEIMASIQTAVAEINQNTEAAYTKLEQLILELKADGDADHTETLGMLEQMQGSLSSAITDNLNQINASFSNLDAELKAYFEKLENSQGAGQEEIGNAIGQLGDNLKENQQVLGDAITAHDAANKSGQQEIKDAIGDHNSSVMAGQEGLTNAVKVHDEGIRGYLEEFKGFVTEKLDQVFRFVSNGKKLLASALLTKGVTIAEDASFQEFADGILAVPQKLVIGVEEVPGEIVYEYHYHVDADGTQVGEVATNEKEGGCYTKAVYHTHGNSCYKWTHEHNNTCKSHPVWVDWVPGVEPYWGLVYECGEPPNKRGDLICKLPTSEDGKPIHYELGCGLSDGQIIGAHIVYEKEETEVSSYRIEKGSDEKILTETGREYPIPTDPPADGEGHEEETESVSVPEGETENDIEIQETESLPETEETAESQTEESLNPEIPETEESAEEEETGLQEETQPETETASDEDAVKTEGTGKSTESTETEADPEEGMEKEEAA